MTGAEYIEYLKENAEKIRAQEDAIKVAQNPGNNWSQNNGIGLGGVSILTDRQKNIMIGYPHFYYFPVLLILLRSNGFQRQKMLLIRDRISKKQS